MPQVSIYVPNSPSNGASVTIYPLNSNGDVPPSSMITGNATGLFGPAGIAVDSGGKIYVANSGGAPNNSGSITIFGAGASGNEAPITVISGAPTGTNNTMLFNPAGITLDSQGNIDVTTDGRSVPPTIPPSVLIFPQGSSGNVAPGIFINSASLLDPYGIAVDLSGNIYVANLTGGASSNGSVTIFSPPFSSGGDIMPSATITGPSTGLSFPTGIALGSNNYVYVANLTGGPSGQGSITVYSASAASAGGNISPIATITGSLTGLSGPVGSTFDSTWNMYVVNSNGPSVTVYPPLGSQTGTVNESPNATIFGSITMLDTPTAIAVGR